MAWQGRGEARVEGLGGLVGGEEQRGGGKGGDDDAANALVEPSEDTGRGLAGRSRAREGLEIILALETSLYCIQRVDDEVDGEGGRSACLETKLGSAGPGPARAVVGRALTSRISVFVLLIAGHLCRTISAEEDVGGAGNVGLVAVPGPPNRTRWMSWTGFGDDDIRLQVFMSLYETDCESTTCTYNI
jgi:hypothetical protein